MINNTPVMKNFNKFFVEKQVLGLIEFLDVEGIGEIPAKLDSGNGAYNVLHGTDIQIQGTKVFFRTVNNKTLVKPVEDTITINVGAGNTEDRPVVLLTVTVGDNTFEDVPFSIGDRETNVFKILVSKDFIQNHLDALIDVSKENIAKQDVQVD